MASVKELHQLIQQAKAQGWVVVKTKGDHFKWLSPLGGFFFSASTPSDHRALKNIKRDLRTHGFIEVSRQNKRKR